jgi:hypothetical protein
MHTANRDCYSYYHGCQPACGTFYLPVVWVQAPQACCDAITVPRDLDVDSVNVTRSGLVGGADKVSLAVEYLVETGAASPSVTLTTTSNGVNSTWSDAAPAVGYHVQEAVMTVDPGTKVSITVNNVTARLRWCERICC